MILMSSTSRLGLIAAPAILGSFSASRPLGSTRNVPSPVLSGSVADHLVDMVVLEAVTDHHQIGAGLAEHLPESVVVHFEYREPVDCA